jgi:hypothetical protein
VLAFITVQRTGQLAGRGALQPLRTGGEQGGVPAEASHATEPS